MGISGLFGKIGGMGGGQGAAGFPVVITQNDLQSVAAGDAVTGAGFQLFGTVTVAAQSQRAWGYGMANTAEAGRFFVDTESSSDADVDGLLRITAENANSTAIDAIQDRRTEETSENPTDITKQIWFPEVKSYPVLGRIPKEDDRLRLYIDLDTNSNTVSTSASQVRLHSTRYNLR